MKLPNLRTLAPLACLAAAGVVTSQGPRLIEFGTGVAGAGGESRIRTTGAPLVGEHFRLSLEGGTPAAHGCLLVGSRSQTPMPLPAFGVTLFVTPDVLAQPFTFDASGSVEDVLVFDVPDLVGLSFAFQPVYVDAGAPRGIASARPVLLEIGAAVEPEIFAGRVPMPLSTVETPVAVRDFNRDGAPDLLTIARARGFAVRPGNFAGGLGDPVMTMQSLRVDNRLAVVGDFDEDGELDVAFHRFDMQVRLGDGTGGFPVAGAQVAASGTPTALLSDDFDSDGHLDLAFDGGTFGIRIAYGDGTGQFPDTDMLAGAFGPVAGDFDGDGRLDFAAFGGFQSPLQVFFNAGGRSFSTGTTLPAFPGAFRVTLLAVDLDDDGRDDLVEISEGNGLRVFLANSRGGAFTGPAVLPHPFGASTDVESAIAEDLDADGDPDLIVSGDDGTIVRLENSGSGVLSLSPATLLGGAPFAFADANFDGVSDWFTTFRPSVGVLLSDGSVGEPILAEQLPRPANAFFLDGVEIIDIDGDGVLDVATGGSSAIASFGVGGGEFLPFVTLDQNTSGMLSFADLNGDGLLDSITSGLDRLGVRLQQAPRTFDPVVSIASFRPDFRTVVDFDGDGSVDVLAAGPGNNTEIVLHRGDGLGSLGPKQTLALENGISHVAFGDVDGDGVVDMVNNNFATDDLRVRLGDGGGGLLPFSSVMVGNSQGEIVLADLDADGTVDLLTTRRTDFSSMGGLLRVEFDPVSGLGPVESMPLPDDLNGLHVADLNGDGHQDLVGSFDVFSSFGANVLVMFGDGAGPLVPAGMFSVAARASGIDSADIDDDGDLDVIVSTTAGVAVLRNRL